MDTKPPGKRTGHKGDSAPSATKAPGGGGGGKGGKGGGGGSSAGKQVRDKKGVLYPMLNWMSKTCMYLLPVNWPAKILMTAAATFLVSRAVIGSAQVKMKEQDIVVYSGIYCGWAIFFLPDVLLHLSPYILGKLCCLFIRLFSAEILLCVFLYFYKGESNVLRRGLNLQPLLGPDYQWMEELAHSVRYILIVGCLSASLVANLFDRPELLIDYVEEDDDDESQ